MGIIQLYISFLDNPRFIENTLHALCFKTLDLSPMENYSQAIDNAISARNLSSSAGSHIKAWLSEPRYSDYVPAIQDLIEAGKWQELDDVFWTVIPFGTGGRRGRMYPVGCNAINDRTVGESAQGLATYVRQYHQKNDSAEQLACGIAYDTRHQSRHFAELCASIMVANGFKVYFLDDYRSTPELSFLVRHKQCQCGIMVTASHNPPSDNAVKVYWSTGGQLVPPHDNGCIAEVEKVDAIETVDFSQALSAGNVVFCREEVDREFLECHLKVSTPGPRNIRVIYSPLHGVGEFNVLSLLTATGFEDVEVFDLHRTPDGDFPNVPGNVSNPENKAVFDKIIERGIETSADVILATDPDCDRLGVAAPLEHGDYSSWSTFSGNQIGVMLADYVLDRQQNAGELSANHYVVTTLVTTGMISKICQSYGVHCYDNNLVGFKWIGDMMDRKGPENFVFGTEESHGYLVGEYARDKDGAVACMLMSELTALVGSRNKSLHEHLDGLYQKHGYHAENLMTIQMEGSDGMKRMEALMTAFRESPPTELGGIKTLAIRDYLEQTRTITGKAPQPLQGPTGNLIFLDLEEDGNYVAVRPSGTEPKVKFYMFTRYKPADLEELNRTRQSAADRLVLFEKDLRNFANKV